MHTAIHKDLKTYFVEEHSQAAYERILEGAGFTDEYFSSKEYFNDADLEAVLGEAEKQLSMTRNEVLTANGKRAAHGLFEAVKPMIEPEWKTLDLVEAVEGRMHKYSREELGAFPPVLKTERVSKDELIVRSKSHRNMWALAVGFIQGFAQVYGENVTVDVQTDGGNVTMTIRKV